MLTRNNSRLPPRRLPRLAPFPPRLSLSFVRVAGACIQLLSSPAPRSRSVSTRILVNTAGFSFHVGVRMLLEDITTGLTCLTRFDAAFLSLPPRARSPVFLTITRTPATSVYRWNFTLETATLVVATERACASFRFILSSCTS